MIKTKNPKIIGLLLAWGAEKWIRPALDQAEQYCDEVIVAVLPHSESMLQFEDKTKDVVKEYSSQKTKLVDIKRGFENHSEAKAYIMNEMLKHTSLFEVGNWIWILDVDEFYTKKAYNWIQEKIRDKNCGRLSFYSKFFYINMKYYLHSEHKRMYRINTRNILPRYKFVPTQHWPGPKPKNFCHMPEEYGMFHYSLLTNPKMRRKQWKIEYPGEHDPIRIQWLDNIYMNYDLSEQEYWNEKCREISGLYSPWFKHDMKPDDNGFLMRYEGEHPELVQKYELDKIADFRKEYE